MGVGVDSVMGMRRGLGMRSMGHAHGAYGPAYWDTPCTQPQTTDCTCPGCGHSAPAGGRGGSGARHHPAVAAPCEPLRMGCSRRQGTQRPCCASREGGGGGGARREAVRRVAPRTTRC